MMTHRQSEALRFICDFIRDQGVSPTYAEISRGLGIASRAASHRLVASLVERGYLRRSRRLYRDLEVIKPPPYRSAVFIPVVNDAAGRAYLDLEHSRRVAPWPAP